MLIVMIHVNSPGHLPPVSTLHLLYTSVLCVSQVDAKFKAQEAAFAADDEDDAADPSAAAVAAAAAAADESADAAAGGADGDSAATDHSEL